MHESRHILNKIKQWPPALAILSLLLAFPVQGQSAAAPAATGDLRDLSTNAEIFAGPEQDTYTLAFRAYVWGMPLVNWAKVRLFQTRPQDPFSERPPHNAGAAINRFGNARKLYGPASTDGVGPNNDTLYSIGSFDIEAGPFVIELPDFGTRYYTFTVYMGDTDSRMSPGQRTHGGQLPPLFLHGEQDHEKAPAGMLPIRADTRYVLIAGRILTDGSELDLAEVHRLQDRIRVRTLQAYRQGSTEEPPVTEQRLLGAGRYPDDAELKFMAELGDILRDWQVREWEAALVASLQPIGLTVSGGFDASGLSMQQMEEIRRGISDAMLFVDRESKQLGTQINGWTTNYGGADFGENYVLRAAVAKDQIGVSIAEEAVYPIGRLDSDGNALDGHYRYRIFMSEEKLPPVNFFWSITLYDDHGRMVDNPIDRYSIGDRTGDLVFNRNGGIEIALQAEQPEPGEVNWLPAPKAPFYLMMRLYGPKQEVFSGAWHPPAIERLP